MEIITRVQEQKPLETREWRKDDGEVVVIKSVQLQLKSGTDVIMCEANDKLAERIAANPLDVNYLYVANLSFSPRKGKDKNGNEMFFQKIKLTEINYL